MAQLNPQDSLFTKFTSEEELEQFLIDEALEEYGKLFGTQQSYYWYDYFYKQEFPGDFPVPPSEEGNNSTATPDTNDFSETNTQVEGVDEADLIETDGNYIYTVDSGTMVNIVDVRDKSKPEAISQIEVKGAYIDGIYLHDNERMTVISTGWVNSINSGSVDSLSILPPIYDYNPVVNVTVLDISDPEEVTVLETTEIEGSLIDTRSLNDKVYVITQDSFGLEAPLLLDENGEVVDFPYYPIEPPIIIDPIFVEPLIFEGDILTDDSSESSRLVDPGIWEGEEKVYTYETEEQYLARIEEEGVLESSLPSYTTTNENGEVHSTGLLTPITQIYQPIEEGFSQNLKTISVFDQTDNQIGIDFSTALPDNDYSWDTVYMSTESLYLASPEWDSETQSTELLKFDLDDGTVDLVAEGEVSGSINNQFSLDEHEGNLRVATTTTDWDVTNGNTSFSNVYILEQNGKELNVIGKTEDLAPGERIFSVRFDGNVAYVVTFRQVDPLFAIDLEDPTNPEVKSELKVPGFSEYLQVINVGGEEHLLGIGRDADPVTGRAGDLKVSLFDLGDLTEVTEVDSYIFPEDGNVWSPAAWEHHGVSYFPQWQVLALPFQSYSYEFNSNVQGLGLFQFSPEGEITRLDDIVHEQAIKRSLRIGNDLVAFSDTKLTIHEFVDSEFTFKGEVELPISTNDYFWETETVFRTGELTDGQEAGLAIAIKQDLLEIPETVYGTQKDDSFDSASPDERLFFGEEQVLITRNGDDYVDVSQVGSGNTISTGNGEDEILTGTNNRIFAGRGKDIINAGFGSGNNKISGGQHEDQFWLVENTDNLVKNTIRDFDIDEDLIGFKNTGLSYADKGDSWDLIQRGNDTLITVFGQRIGILLNTSADALTSDNFDIS